MWWPGPGWEPWDALVAAGVRVVDDIRNLAPPAVLMEIDSVTVEGGCAYTFLVKASIIAPAPDAADARKWIWTVAAPVLLPHAVADGIRSSPTFEDSDLPAADLLIQHTFTEGA